MALSSHDAAPGCTIERHVILCLVERLRWRCSVASCFLNEDCEALRGRCTCGIGTRAVKAGSPSGLYQAYQAAAAHTRSGVRQGEGGAVKAARRCGACTAWLRERGACTARCPAQTNGQNGWPAESCRTTTRDLQAYSVRSGVACGHRFCWVRRVCVGWLVYEARSTTEGWARTSRSKLGSSRKR